MDFGGKLLGEKTPVCNLPFELGGKLRKGNIKRMINEGNQALSKTLPHKKEKRKNESGDFLFFWRSLNCPGG